MPWAFLECFWAFLINGCSVWKARGGETELYSGSPETRLTTEGVGCLDTNEAEYDAYLEQTW